MPHRGGASDGQLWTAGAGQKCSELLHNLGSEADRLVAQSAGNEVKIEPYHGSRYEFEFMNPAMRDTVYEMLSEKNAAATQGVRR